mmetsp:Transcript_37840/g.67597  ORF Transcript_37840/g.67597 Transcript_37840/m.67597 type:complete len:321 (+) Transcript_37840:404-1366(+)
MDGASCRGVGQLVCWALHPAHRRRRGPAQVPLVLGGDGGGLPGPDARPAADVPCHLQHGCRHGPQRRVPAHVLRTAAGPDGGRDVRAGLGLLDPVLLLHSRGPELPLQLAAPPAHHPVPPVCRAASVLRGGAGHHAGPGGLCPLVLWVQAVHRPAGRRRLRGPPVAVLFRKPGHRHRHREVHEAAPLHCILPAAGLHREHCGAVSDPLLADERGRVGVGRQQRGAWLPRCPVLPLVGGHHRLLLHGAVRVHVLLESADPGGGLHHDDAAALSGDRRPGPAAGQWGVAPPSGTSGQPRPGPGLWLGVLRRPAPRRGPGPRQ